MSKPVAIVTGAGKGIGRAIARELASRGHQLVLTARTASDLRETATDAVIVPGDVADPAHAQRVINEALKLSGRVDVLVNNAGYAPMKVLDELNLDEWRRIVDVNLSGTFYFCKAAWPVMKKQGSGVIVNISSLSARDPFKGLTAYGAAKAGVNLLGLGLAREGEEFGIRVHTVAPGAVETGMLRSIISKEQYAETNTLDPAEIARVVGECVNGSLRHTSGEVIPVHKRL